MKYEKQPIDFRTQLGLLKEKGMRFDNEDHALECLYSISYFRLESYWNHHELSETGKFKDDVKFEKVLYLYSFDQKLRNIIFASLQNIEIAFRTRISHFISVKYGAFWFLDATLFKDSKIHRTCLTKLKEEIDRSNEDFIKVHMHKYNSPSFPPSWKTLEVASFGTLSKLYGNLTDTKIKKEIARSFRLPSYLFLENWMRCAAVLRNCCAHHSRLWNRRFSVIPKYPSKLPASWITTPLRRPEKLYGQICCLVYLEKSINPNSGLKKHITELIEQHPEINLNAMGFPLNWAKEPLWIY